MGSESSKLQSPHDVAEKVSHFRSSRAESKSGNYRDECCKPFLIHRRPASAAHLQLDEPSCTLSGVFCGLSSEQEQPFNDRWEQVDDTGMTSYDRVARLIEGRTQDWTLIALLNIRLPLEKWNPVETGQVSICIGVRQSVTEDLAKTIATDVCDLLTR